MNTRLTFRQGLADALPIFFGYLSVAVAFGILAAARDVPVWLAAFVSMTAFSGTGQFVWLDLIASLAAIAQTFFALAVINARYFLMSLSLSQRLPEKLTLWQRLIIGFGNTDEVFAVAMTRTETLSFKYLLGLILCSWAGWVGGTLIGGMASGLIPDTILSALGIALYAMFIALIVPPAKKSLPVAAVAFTAASLNCVLRLTGLPQFIGESWSVIISGTAAAAVGAALFPVKNEAGEAEASKQPKETKI